MGAGEESAAAKEGAAKGAAEEGAVRDAAEEGGARGAACLFEPVHALWFELMLSPVCPCRVQHSIYI